MLIALQRPDATRVAGFNNWGQLGRGVKRGEKAIYIVALLIYRDKNEDADPEIRGFRWVPVFDLSQTEGDDLPVAAHKLIGTDSAQLSERLEAVASAQGFLVSRQELPAEINGLCRHDTREILISPANSPLHQVKTLGRPMNSPMRSCTRGRAIDPSQNLKLSRSPLSSVEPSALTLVSTPLVMSAPGLVDLRRQSVPSTQQQGACSVVPKSSLMEFVK